jgi:hypothetical protein
MNTLTDKSYSVARPAAVRWLAHFVSVVFHPLFVPVYITYLLAFVHPLLFAGYDSGAKWRLIITVFINLSLFPALTVFLCWRLKFVDSIKMTTQKERIIPLAAAMIFYFWGWYVLRNLNAVPDVLKQFLLGCFITIIIGWIANIYYKVSLHALGMGGLLGFIVLLVFNFEGGSGQYLAVALLVSGLVCSARLILSSHKPFEVYSGLFLGILAQIVAVFF